MLENDVFFWKKFFSYRPQWMDWFFSVSDFSIDAVVRYEEKPIHRHRRIYKKYITEQNEEEQKSPSWLSLPSVLVLQKHPWPSSWPSWLSEPWQVSLAWWRSKCEKLAKSLILLPTTKRGVPTTKRFQQMGARRAPDGLEVTCFRRGCGAGVYSATVPSQTQWEAGEHWSIIGRRWCANKVLH